VKRGAGMAPITLEGADAKALNTPDEVLALDAALTELARIAPRQAAMIESRFFGGLDVAETAALLEVSEATVLRDWRSARAWLARELRQVE
jgi:DNA-directed RNA polymerase specialized sigma24 family protein